MLAIVFGKKITGNMLLELENIFTWDYEEKSNQGWLLKSTAKYFIYGFCGDKITLIYYNLPKIREWWLNDGHNRGFRTIDYESGRNFTSRCVLVPLMELEKFEEFPREEI